MSRKTGGAGICNRLASLSKNFQKFVGLVNSLSDNLKSKEQMLLYLCPSASGSHLELTTGGCDGINISKHEYANACPAALSKSKTNLVLKSRQDARFKNMQLRRKLQ